MSLELQNIIVSREGTPIVKGVSLTLAPGELIVIRGANGSGKSTLLSALMGHPKYQVASGQVSVDGENITALPTHERARRGLFLALQQPPEVAGVAVNDFMRTSLSALRGERPRTAEFDAAMGESLAKMRLDPSFARRSVNEGFSGGEKKRSELLQMLVIRPKYALLDEVDSGLDPDALQFAADAIIELRKAGTGFIVVTHADHFAELLSPSAVYTMQAGTMQELGGRR